MAATLSNYRAARATPVSISTRRSVHRPHADSLAASPSGVGMPARQLGGQTMRGYTTSRGFDGDEKISGLRANCVLT